MLTQEQLLELLGDLESDRIEHTRSPNDTDKFAQAVCAFANDLPQHGRPGYLLVGVDEQGRPVGLRVTDQILQNLGALRSDGNILPQPVIAVHKMALPGGEIAVVEVQPSDLPPVRYGGRVWIRVGPRKAMANEQEERILSERRVSSALTFDALPCLDASLRDLSEERFALVYRRKAVAEEIVAENNRPLEIQLASLRLYDLRHNCPTHAGILLLADRPTHWLPGAYVQFVRFGGGKPVDPVVNEKRLKGDLSSLLQQLDMLLDLAVRQRPVFVTGFREEMRSDYPRMAVRELMLNAVMHRDYQSTAPVRFFWFDDRIQIHSPGGLYGAVSPDNFPGRTDYRNPLIAEAMRTLGYVNRFGVGVLRAQEALKINGNPAAEFQFDPYTVTVTIRAIDL